MNVMVMEPKMYALQTPYLRWAEREAWPINKGVAEAVLSTREYTARVHQIRGKMDGNWIDILVVFRNPVVEQAYCALEEESGILMTRIANYRKALGDMTFRQRLRFLFTKRLPAKVWL